VTVTATDSTGASGSAAFTWTISGTTAGGTCQVTYATQSQWSGGFVAGITITNASYNGTISPGGNTTLGFQGTWTNSDATPTAFALNGTTCTT
jgi:Cellulose binding domain